MRQAIRPRSECVKPVAAPASDQTKIATHAPSVNPMRSSSSPVSGDASAVVTEKTELNAP
jgi:hypothetical protein